MIGCLRNVLTCGPGRRKYDEKRAAMLNDIVLRRVFSCLDLKCLKNCRLVCNKWAYICEPFFIKNATICYAIKDDCEDDSNPKPKKQRKLPSHFKDIFQCSFESFKFMGVIPLSVVEDLLIKSNCGVKELAIIKVELTDEHGHRIYCCDERIGERFYRYNLDTLVPNTITKLHLDCSFSRCTRLEISLNRLSSVQYLVLKGLHSTPKKSCAVIVNGRIAPIEMALENVFFRFEDGGKIKPSLVLSEFINFHQIKKLRLLFNVIEDDSPHGKIFGVLPILDLKEFNATVHTLELDATRILDWGTASLNINKLFVCKESPFLHRNTIKAKEVQIYNNSDVDLAFLPKTIERLTLGSGGVHVTCRDQINLTKLSYLYLRGDIAHFTHFKNCFNLVVIVLWSFEIQELNLNLVPLSVKRIVLKGNLGKIEIVGEGAFELENLTLGAIQWRRNRRGSRGSCP